MKILALLLLSGFLLFSIAGVVPLCAQCPVTTHSLFEPTIGDLQKEYEQLEWCLTEVHDTAELAYSKTDKVDSLESKISEMEDRLTTAEEKLRSANLRIDSLERQNSRWEQLVERALTARRPTNQPKAAVSKPKGPG